MTMESQQANHLRDLVTFVQFKKLEKHPWRSDTFSSSIGVFHVFKIVQMLPNRATCLISSFSRYNAQTDSFNFI